ncbi:MAG: hypothetical protein HY873_10685 [Chloroflexi bacterium]|nr:hypothetical protein [Chloroflexota bacterium]
MIAPKGGAMLDRLRETWDDWWKVIALFALVIGAVWFVIECNQNERTEFLNCLDDRLPPGYDVLYDTGGSGEPDPYYDLIDRQAAIDTAEECYDDTQGVNSPGDGEPLDDLR